jgi:site-specific recombinase XerD
MVLMDDFFKTIRSYLTIYLPNQQCCSENTVKSYRESLNFLVDYLRVEKGLRVSQITFSLFDQVLISDYLNWLQKTRGYSRTSLNQRLMALRAFFNYAGVMDCTQVDVYTQIKKIPVPKEPGRIVEFFTEDALQTLLAQPNPHKQTDSRNQFFMVLMYDTAARCGEMLNLKLRDLRIDSKYPMAYLTGKGDKTRTVPLMGRTVQLCKLYLDTFHPSPNSGGEDYLFFTTAHGVRQQMSADNVACFMKKYGESARQVCPEIPEKVHPHQLRHTRAIHLYRSGMPLALLAEYLGHSNVETTKIYAYADTEMKRAAIQKADHLRSALPVPEPIWVGDEDMILKLSGLK